jgi:FKBP-type peptidyl-prolyl cis-trans isomerase
MEKEGLKPSGEPSQTAEEGQSRILEKRKFIMAVTQMLDSGTLDEKSFRLLEQLADCIQHPPAEMAREAEPDKQAAAQQATPTRGDPVEVEPSGVPKVEPGPGGDSKCPAGKKVIVGSLRTTLED